MDIMNIKSTLLTACACITVASFNVSAAVIHTYDFGNTANGGPDSGTLMFSSEGTPLIGSNLSNQTMVSSKPPLMVTIMTSRTWMALAVAGLKQVNNTFMTLPVLTVRY